MKNSFTERFVGISPKEYENLDDRHKKVLKIFSSNSFNKILDVGCGDGNFTTLLGKACNASEIYGVEISDAGIQLARKNGIIASKINIDEEDLPFENNSFDAIFAGEIIEHLYDPDHFFEEVHRVLKPKGIFVLSTPNLAAIHNRIALLFGFQPFPMSVSLRKNIGRIFEPTSEPQSLDHIRGFSLRSLCQQIKMNNFIILLIMGSRAMLPKNMKFKQFISLIDKFFTLFPGLSYRVIIVSSKGQIE